MKIQKQPVTHWRPNGSRSRVLRIGLIAPLLATLQLIGGSAPVWAETKNPTTEQIAGEIAKGVGSFVRQTSAAKGGTVYVFEENHASLRGQVQIATMLTRLLKREGLRTIGLEGAIQTDKPLPTKSFITGTDPVARLDTLRRMLADGEISGVEYVGAVHPDVEVWGLEKKEEYEVQPPEGMSPSFIAVLMIAEKILPEQKLRNFAELSEANKVDAALELLKASDPWLRAQLEGMTKSSIDLNVLEKRQLAILKKAEEIHLVLPPEVKRGIDQTRRFYEIAGRRSITMVSAIANLARSRPGEPLAMIIGAAHSDEVTKALQEAGLHALLLRPKNLEPNKDDRGMAAFENKVKGRWANDAKESFGELLNPKKRDRKPPPLIGDVDRKARASLHYAVSRAAFAARNGQRIPEDILGELSSLPGGVRVDPTSFSQDGYDVIFRLEVEEPGKPLQSIWVRTGTVKPNRDAQTANQGGESLEHDMEQLGAAGNEPPRKPPGGKKSGTESPDPSNPKRGPDGKRPGEGVGRVAFADAASKYKAFESKEAARACPMISTQ